MAKPASDVATMLEDASNAISRLVTALTRVGYDAEKLELIDEAPPQGLGDGARLRHDARLPGPQNAALRVSANLLRLSIVFGLSTVVLLLLSLLLAD
jgi:hypothetical protein